MLNANFTVLGLSLTPTVLNNKFVRHPGGRIVTSMPPRLQIFACYIAQFLANLKHAICDVNDVVSQPYSYYEISRVVAEGIATIPVRTKRKDPPDVKDSCGLSNFRPWQISGRNCGSNEGTASIMTKIFHACRPLLTTSYSYVRMDVDLYMKWMRVCFLFFFCFIAV